MINSTTQVMLEYFNKYLKSCLKSNIGAKMLMSVTGVKKLQILGIVENVSETHSNVEKLVEACDLQDLDHESLTFTGDQKMGYTLCGHQGQNSTRPCMYCLALKPLTGDEDAELRTLGQIRKNYQDFEAAVGPSKKGSLHNNIAHRPLLPGPDDKLVLDCFPVPTLHVKLRAVNHMLDQLTAESMKRFGTDIVVEFCKQSHIVKKDYFGGNYEGNMVDAILKKLTRLDEKLPEDLKKFTRSLKRLGRIVS